MGQVFVDTNVFLRHLLQDHPRQSPRATRFLARVEDGELEAHLSDTIVLEMVYTLQRTYRQSKTAIRDVVLPIIELQGMILPGKRRYRRVFDLYVERNISFADAYHVVHMGQLDVNEIMSFDRDFDRCPEVKRLQP